MAQSTETKWRGHRTHVWRNGRGVRNSTNKLERRGRPKRLSIERKERGNEVLSGGMAKKKNGAGKGTGYLRCTQTRKKGNERKKKGTCEREK